MIEAFWYPYLSHTKITCNFHVKSNVYFPKVEHLAGNSCLCLHNCGYIFDRISGNKVNQVLAKQEI